MHYIYIIGVVLSWIIIALTLIHVILDNRQPAKTMAWALIILFVPVIGIIFYFFFGVNHRRERLVSQRSLDQLSKRSMLTFVEQQNLKVPETHKQMVDLFVNQSLSLPFKDNFVDIMTDGYAFFPELLKDIAKAKHHIHVDMYIFEDDALGFLVSDALIAKARQGVEVRVIYDDVGCWKVQHMTGYIGGMNIAVRYVKGTTEQPWRDTMLRLTGGAVYALQRAFLIDWYFVDRTLITKRTYYPPLVTDQSNECLAQVVTSGPISDYPEIMQGMVRSILAARRYIYIETPYFLPNDPVLFALKTAAVGGVDVRILCPLHSDARFTDWASRSYLRELHQAGAQIYLYKAGFLHSKLMVCDDSLSSCGSANVDFRSFENNFEANVFLYDQGTALRFKKVFLDDQAQSIPLSELPQRLNPKFLQRLWESLTRLLSPLL